MTNWNDTYFFTHTSEFNTLTTDQKVTPEDIANLAYVGSEKVEFESVCGALTMTCSEAFAEEIANTKGIELISAKTGQVVQVKEELRLK